MTSTRGGKHTGLHRKLASSIARDLLLLAGLGGAVPLAGQNAPPASETSPAGEWAWISGSQSSLSGSPGVYGSLGMPAGTANFPGSRESAVGWRDKSGNFWLFGGYGYANSSTSFGWLNDLWEFNPSNNEWVWMGGSNTVTGYYGADPATYVPVAGGAYVPGGREGASSWTDKNGNLWLFGGLGEGAAVTACTGSGFDYLNDLWEFNPTAGEPSTDQWAWVGGECTPNAPGKYPATYGFAPGIAPGARDYASTWTDSNGNFWLFGGEGYDGTTPNPHFGELNDLWEFDPLTTQWAWWGGSSTIPTYSGAPGGYGTQGVFAGANVPGGRYGATSWVDSSGNLWLFGGAGFDAVGNSGNLNDLWEFNPAAGEPSTDQWAWMGGSSAVSSAGGWPGLYGMLGTPTAENLPGGRYEPVSWSDKNGNFWLFGGDGFSATAGSGGLLNDLWAFDPKTSEWVWMDGSSMANQFGVYSPQYSPASDSVPGGRDEATSWTDIDGNLWLFGGDGTDGTINNDLWVYQPPSISFVGSSVPTPVFNVPSGTYATTQIVSISDATPNATIYYTTDGSTPTTSSNVYYSTSPITVSSTVPLTEMIEAIATASGFTSAVGTAVYTICTTCGNANLFTLHPAPLRPEQMVTISDATPEALIFYTTNDMPPSFVGTVPNPGTSIYTGPITVSSSEIIEAQATAGGYSSSAVGMAAYTSLVETATTVTAAPTSAVVGQEVVLTGTVTALSGTSAPPGNVTFTSDDGTTIPAAALSALSRLAAAGVTNTSNLTIGVRTITAAYAANTGFVGSQGTVQVTILPAAPVFTPSGGGLFPGQTVSIAAATGASIYYTLDGSLPTANSTPYTAPIAISGTSPVTIEAIAVESGTDSEVSTAVFNPLPQQQLAIAPGYASVYQNLALQNLAVGLRAVVDKNGDFFELSYSTPDLYSINSSGNSAQFSPNSTAFCGLALSPDGTTLGVSTCNSSVWLLAPELGASAFTGSLVNFPLVFPASAADSMHKSGALAWGGPDQHLFIVDNSDLHILEFDNQGNYVRTLNEGANRDAVIDSIAVDASGNLYFAENLPTGATLMEIPAGGTLKTLSPALVGASQPLQLNLVDDMTTDAAGDLYFVDGNGAASSTYSEIYMLNSAGAATAIAGNALNADAQSSLASGASGPAWDVDLTYPTGVAVNPQGQIYIGQSTFVYFDDTLNAQVNFGDIDPLTQTISAYNPYASPIGLSQMTISGTNAADFQMGQLAGCSATSATSMNPGASCSIPVTYSPSTASTETSTLTLSLAGNATETIGLSGALIPTTTQLQMVPSTAQSGVPLATTVQVTPAFGSTSSLTGTVSITDTYTAPGASSPTVVTYTSNASSSPVITLHGAGTHTLAASYSGDPDHSGSATPSYPVLVTLQVPVIIWMTPAPMTLGSPLTTTQLDASVAPGVTGPVPAGSLTYTPPPGTLVNTLGSNALSVTFTPTDSLDFAGASDTVDVSVTKAVPSIAVVTPTATYGASESIAITVTGVLGLVPTGAVTLTLDTKPITIPAASSTSAASSSATYTYNAGVLIGGTHTVEVEYLGDNNYTTAVVMGQSLSFTVAPATTTVSLTSSSITTDENTPVNLTATVSSTVGAIPDGDAVSFYSGTNFLGARMTSNGTATLPASFAAAGTFSLTATYMGDIDFSTSTSQPVLQVVATPDYTISVNPPSLTIVQGQTGTAVFTVTSIGGYSTPITFACSGLPQYATCTFNPASVTPTAAGATTTLTIQTDVAQASLSPVPESRPGSPAQGKLLAGSTLAAVFLLFFCGQRNRMLRRFRSMNARRVLWLAAILASGWIVTSCGGSSAPKTPTGQNTLTITTTGGTGSSADVHTVALNVTITK